VATTDGSSCFDMGDANMQPSCRGYPCGLRDLVISITGSNLFNVANREPRCANRLSMQNYKEIETLEIMVHRPMWVSVSRYTRKCMMSAIGSSNPLSAMHES
jgi:hypothetical protein